MNKRARTRLIGVTVIIVVAVAAILAGSMSKTGAYDKTVAEIVEDQTLVGQRIKVSGVVVSGSWDKQSNPMKFAIGDEGVNGGPTLNVVYQGQVPSTFGDKVTAIVTGELQSGGTINSTSMITKCPSKYESGAEAISVSVLLADEKEQKAPNIQVMGYVTGAVAAPGTSPRFTIADKPGSAQTIPVTYEGGVPTDIKDGTAIVLTGHYESGTFSAIGVGLAKGK